VVDATYRLYWFPGTCARVTVVALEEIGVGFETILSHELRAQGAYDAINPKAKVPVLIAEGRAITENPAIQTFLSRRHPEVGLIPARREVEALELMSWFAAGVHPCVRNLRAPQLSCSLAEAYSSIRAIANRELEAAFKLLEESLRGRDWLLDSWSIVDAYMLWLWFRATGSGMDGSPFPRCADHALRCEARPTVAKVLLREEAELQRLEAAGALPTWAHLPYQGGRAPTTFTRVT
jgi:glutathione S-transferase